jgi:hypothetical protein
MRRDSGDFQQAERLVREGLLMARKFFGAHPRLAMPLRDFAAPLADRGDFDEALKVYREAFLIADRHQRLDRRLPAQIAFRIGEVLLLRGDCRRALSSLSEALGRLKGAESSAEKELRKSTLLRLAQAHAYLGEREAAGPYVRELVQAADQHRQDDEIAPFALDLVDLLRILDQTAEASRVDGWTVELALRYWRDNTSPSPKVLPCAAGALARQQRWEACQALLERALAADRSSKRSSPLVIAQRCRDLGLAMLQRAQATAPSAEGKQLLQDAQPLLDEALDKRERCFGPDSHYAAESLLDRARLHLALGQGPQARADAEEALERRRRVQGAKHLYTARAMAEVAEVLTALGDTSHATALARESQQALRMLLPPTHPELAAR